MKNRIVSWVLVFLMMLSVLPVSTSAAAADETLFERYIPINQVYSAGVSPYQLTLGSPYTFFIGTQFKDENKNLTFSEPLKRKDLQGYYLKLTYEGTFGSLDKEDMMRAFNLNESNYLLAMNDPSVERYANYHQLYTEDTIIISIDLYDQNKQFVQNLSPATAIMAVGPDGEFLTCAMPQGVNVSMYFSTQDNIFKGTDDIKNSGRVIHFTPEYTWLDDLNVSKGLIGSSGGEVEKFNYEFIQYPEIDCEPQYMTNNILSTTEFISPDNTYYQVGHLSEDIDPTVINKIENVVDYSEYGLVLTAGNTRRSILTADGTLYGVSTDHKKEVLAKGVKQAGKAHYMTANGEVKEIVSGKTIATDCKAFAEHRYATVIAVLKNDGSVYLGYTYLGEENAYNKGLSKVLDNAKAVVAGGVCGSDNKFYRWSEKVIPKGYDPAAWSRGEFVQYNDYVLSLEVLTENAVRVFPDEYFTAQESTAEDAVTGFVINKDGDMWGFGLQSVISLGNLGLIKHIFPIYQSQRSKAFLDNGNFVGLLPEDTITPYGLVANHCTSNRPKVGILKADYLTDVPGGYKATDGYTYAFDNDATDGSSGRSYKVKPTELHYLNDVKEVFKALNTTTNPIVSLPLLPNVARSSYAVDNNRGNTVLLERTDGSMWMTQLYPKASAANIVAKLGGWECSNAIQITQPTKKITDHVDYVNLIDEKTLAETFGLVVSDPHYDEKSDSYIVSDYYTQLTPAKADSMYEDFKEPFMLIVCRSNCAYCNRLKPYVKEAIEREKVPVYGCVDDYSSLQFYWNFVYGDTVDTPVFVLVKGKGDVEVASGVRTESAVDEMLKKAKAIFGSGDRTSDVKSKCPTDKISVNEYEWEVLRLVNRERFENGLSLLTMPEALQLACNTRENELVTQFSHIRPNGDNPFTAISSAFDYLDCGENIACGQNDSAQVVDDWMNSTGHRANILNKNFGYMGVGCLKSNTKYWLQLFADAKGFTSITTSAGKLNFANESDMQSEYLVCTDQNGVVSYMPIDVGAMKKDGNTYTLELLNKTVTLTIGNAAAATGFSDVKPTDWFAQAVEWALAKNITNGTSETTFSPNQTCTRAQILTFLWRAVGSPKAKLSNPFDDVKMTDYYYDAAIWAYRMNMIDGERFEGTTPCTRAATVEYLWKYAGSPEYPDLGVFDDVDPDAEYSTAVAWAVANKVTSGVSETEFAPGSTCTRGQIVTFLNRAIK